MARRLGCWLLAGALTVLGCLALSGCVEYNGPSERDRSDENTRQCFAMGGAPATSMGQWYEGCDFPPQPCPPLPAEAP